MKNIIFVIVGGLIGLNVFIIWQLTYGENITPIKLGCLLSGILGAACIMYLAKRRQIKTE